MTVGLPPSSAASVGIAVPTAAVTHIGVTRVTALDAVLPEDGMPRSAGPRGDGATAFASSVQESGTP